MEYVKPRLQQAITIDAVVSVHYYEYPIDFAFSGEVHDFWELVYVDKGEAVITAGGVSVKEIDPRTMQSRLVKGLAFAGEVMDVDAVTGGYNLQIAWSTGYLAGTAAV